MTEDANSPSNPDVAKIASQERYYLNDKTAKVDISDGSWDPDTGIYIVVNESTGIITEFKLKKYPAKTGFSVQEKKYKMMNDPTSVETKKVEIHFNSRKQEWVPKPTLKKAKDNLRDHSYARYMGSVSIDQIGNNPKAILHVEKMKERLF